jgi:predicted MFS family arabinose efflux permease
MTFSTGFQRLAASNLAAQSAEQIALAAAPMLAVLSLGAGAAETGLLSAAQSLPFLLLSLPAGVLADRMRRNHLMTAAELLRAVALLSLPAMLWTHTLSLVSLAVIGALTATGTVVFSVAAPALVPALVSRAALAAANTRLELARSVAFAAGPALAGALTSWFGGGPVFLLAAALSLIAALFLTGTTEPLPARSAPRHIHADLIEALRFVRRQSLLQPIMATAVVWNLSWFVLQSVYVLYASDHLGLDAAGIGLTLAAYGAGMLAGAVAAPRMSRRMAVGRFIVCGPLGSVAGAVLLLASWLLPGIALPLVGYFLFGFGPILWTIGQTTLRQAVTPPDLLGRVSALFMMAAFGARPIGAALGGFVGATLGLDWALALSAGGFVVQAGIILLSRIPDLEVLPDMAAAEQA